MAGAAALLRQRHPDVDARADQVRARADGAPGLQRHGAQASDERARRGRRHDRRAGRRRARPVRGALGRLASGCCALGTAATRTVELERRGRWRRHVVGERARASTPRRSIDGARRRLAEALELTLQPARRSSVGNRSGNVVLTSGTHTVHIRWWGYVERPRLANAALAAPRGRALDQGRHARGHEARAALPLAGRPGRQRPAARLSRARAAVVVHVPRGARNAGVEAEGSRRAADPARPRREPPGGGARAALERQSVPRDLRPLRAGERAARPGPRAATSSSSRRGRATGRAPTACASGSTTARRPRSRRIPHAVGRSADELRFHVADTGSGVSAPDLVVRRGRHAGGRLGLARAARCACTSGGLEVGRHRLEITASDLQETKNSENASALALPNTRTVHTAFTVGATG